MSQPNQYAHSLLEIKSVDVARRIVSGIASTPSPDRGGDVMVPEGAQFKLPMPFLWNHKDPIGEVFEAKVVPGEGIYIKAQISTVSAPGRLKDFVDEAWASISASPPLVRGLSIGWSPIQSARVAGTKLTRVAKWFWGETSAVVVPMNAEATILSIKSIDAAGLAASGTRPSVPVTPGVTGLRKGAAIMKISEQIETAQTELDTKSARLQELMTKDDVDGGLEAEEVTERNALSDGIDAITTKIKNLKSLEGAQAIRAKSVYPASAQPASRAPHIEVVNLEKGTLFTRYAMAVAAGKGSISDTLAYAKRWDGQTPEVSRYIKSVAGSTIDESPGWGSQMVYANNLSSEFAELLRPKTILGRISGFRMTPFNVRVLVQSGGSTVNWVGEKAAKPVTELDFTTVTMAYDKIAGIIVLTDELIRLGTPSAEATVRQDLTDAIAQFMDTQFILPSVSATANNPASVTNGVSAGSPSGTGLDDLFRDLNTALGNFDSVDLSTEDVVIVTTPTVARNISAMRNSLGQQDSQVGVTPNGGTLMGYPVIVSRSVRAGDIVLIKPSEILKADDGRVTLDSSNQATLDMAGGDTPTFNLWQKNCTGIRAERWVTWKKRRSAAVQMIASAAYAPS